MRWQFNKLNNLKLRFHLQCAVKAGTERLRGRKRGRERERRDRSLVRWRMHQSSENWIANGGAFGRPESRKGVNGCLTCKARCAAAGGEKRELEAEENKQEGKSWEDMVRHGFSA